MRRKMYSTGCKRYPLSRIQPLRRAEGATAPLAQGSREAAPITFVHACTYCFRAAFVYLSLSLLLPQSGNKIQLPPQREPRALPRRAQSSQKCVPQLRPPQAGGPHPSRCGLRRTAPPSPRGRLCAPHRAQGSPRRHCAAVRPDLLRRVLHSF